MRMNKMNVFARAMEGTRTAKYLVTHDLGIEIHHDGNVYTLNEDTYGNLVFTTIEKTQLSVRPRSANSIEISAE